MTSLYLGFYMYTIKILTILEKNTICTDLIETCELNFPTYVNFWWTSTKNADFFQPVLTINCAYSHCSRQCRWYHNRNNIQGSCNCIFQMSLKRIIIYFIPLFNNKTYMSGNVHIKAITHTKRSDNEQKKDKFVTVLLEL